MRSLLLTVALVCSTVSASAQAPVLHAKLIPASKIIVGQPVRLVVEVLVPNFFTGAPDFPTFELENAIVVLPEETAENFNELVNGQPYSGIRRTYLLYPQLAGDFRLPSAQVGVVYASAPPKTAEAHLVLPPLTFHADVPTAAQGLPYFLPTTQLTLQQRWSTPLNKLRVGDTVERTITITALKMRAMLIPPLPFEAPAGVKVYSEEPKVQDQNTDRGEFVLGRRIEVAKYFLQKEGDYTLPAIELKWWDLDTSRLVTATLPAVHFVTAPNPDYVQELPPEPEIATAAPPSSASQNSLYRKIISITPWLLSALLLLWMAYRYIPRLTRYSKTRRKQHKQSEEVYFRTLIRACRHNDSQATYRSLLLWLGKSEFGNRLDRFLYLSNDEELTQQVNALTETIYATTPGKTWSGRTMANRLRKHRDKRRSARQQRTELPSLNPNADRCDVPVL
jgi:BatD DUF11 like domain